MGIIQSLITKKVIAGIAAQSAAETAGAVVQTAAQKPVIAAKFFKAFAGLPFVGQALALAAIGTTFAFIGRLANFNKGGVVPGIGTKDTVPALLTPGELVIPKRQVGAFMGANIEVNIFNPVVDDDDRLEELSERVGEAILSRVLMQSQAV